ncbi:MAG TPA: hypothetical protein VM934_17605 [Pyrinomonadaceae bacterium]|jgi:hypothetical protein|nr:hypothetical protein [Pyrinomonadaceae bacterium]
MRWKMLLLSALIAAVSGAGLTILFVFAGEYLEKSSDTYVLIVAILFPLAATITVGNFVYRHTARRRVLQAILASTLTVIAACGLIYTYHLLLEDRPGSPAIYKRLTARRA